MFRLNRIILTGLLLLSTSLFGQIPTPIRTVTSLPGSCNGGTAGVATDKVVLVANNVGVEYTCLAPNTWVPTEGGVNSQTVSYLSLNADNGKTIVMNGSNLTITLPNPPPSNNWKVFVSNLNGTNLTVSRNGLTIDGTAANLTLAQNQGAYITTDGINYFTQRGISAAASFASLNGGTNTTSAFVVGTGSSMSTSGSGTIAATSAPFSGISTGTNSTGAIMQVGNYPTDLSPASSGNPQLTAQSAFYSTNGVGPVPPAPSGLTATLTGGSLSNANTIAAVATFTTAAGEGLASQETIVAINTLSGGACNTGSSCTVTVPAPAFPAGVTGWTLYDVVGAPPLNRLELRQAASNNCVNLGAGVSCTVATAAAGPSFPTINAAMTQPPGAQPSECPAFTNPFMWVQDVNGNYHTQASIDQFSATGGPPPPGGTMTFCRRTWFNDTGISPPGFNNTFVLVRHLSGTGTVVAVNQDRALSVYHTNPTNDTTARYAMEAIQAEVDLNGAPTIIGSPDGEVSAGSFQAADLHTNNIADPPAQFNAIRATASRSGAGRWNSCTVCMSGIIGQAVNNNTASYGGGFMVGGYFTAIDLTGTPTAVGGAGVYIASPTSLNTNYGLEITSVGAAGAGINNRNIYSISGDGLQGVNVFNGPIINGSGAGTSSVISTFSINIDGTGGYANLLVKLNGAVLTKTATTDVSSQVVGVCIFNCGSNQLAVLASVSGAVVQCIFDGATTAGNYAIVSTTTAGNCHDSGTSSNSAAAPANTVGKVLSTNGAGGTFLMIFQPKY